MDKTKLNRLRRMAGAPVDYTPEPRKVTSLVEDGIPGISQIFRGGESKFYLVCDAEKKSELGDVLYELDFPALTNILKSAKDTSDWELFPVSQKNKALDLARKRLATVTETVGYGMEAGRPENTPYPTDEEIDAAVHGADDVDNEEVYDELDDFEPSTNICPDCEGGEHPPAVGDCERCDGLGEIFESTDDTKQWEINGADAYDPNADVNEEVKLLKCSPNCKTAFKKGWNKAAKANVNEGTDDTKQWEINGADAYDPNADVNKEVKLLKCPANCKAAFKKGWNKAAKAGAKEEEEEVKKCKCDCDPAKCKCSPDCKCGCNAKEEVKEAHYHTDKNYPLSHVEDENSPINVDSSYENVFDFDPDQIPDDYHPTNDTTPVKVPSRILSELKRVIKEVTAESEKAKPRDFERAHYYEATAEAMQIVHDLLAEKTVQGLKKAQLYVHRMANVSRALLPDVVWKFLVDGGEKRSLKSYYNEVKEPVLGKPFANIGITQLNKNTNTE